MIKKLISERKDVFWFFGFMAFGMLFYGAKLVIKDYHIVHLPIDDKIPFLPIFIIPYTIWFAYIPGMMILTFFKSKKAFLRQQYAFYLGVGISCLIFLIYPTMIDFRPDAAGDGFLLWLTRIVYSGDVPPTNVFPSLHCYEALSVHLTTFTVGPFKDKTLPRILSAVLVVLICLATVFVKQHSVIDVLPGCLMAVLSLITIDYFLRGNKNESDNSTV